jgi:hypothetical protein
MEANLFAVKMLEKKLFFFFLPNDAVISIDLVLIDAIMVDIKNSLVRRKT